MPDWLYYSLMGAWLMYTIIITIIAIPDGEKRQP
jgi:hypothetical protein